MSADFDSYIAAEMGPLIAARRRRAGMSQREFSRQIGIRSSFLCKVEAGAAGVSLAMLYRMARGLGCHPRDLLPEPGQTETRRQREMRRHQTSAPHRASTCA